MACAALAAPALAAPPLMTQAPVTSGGPLSMSGHQLRFYAVIDVASNGGPLTLSGSRVDTSVNTIDAFQTVDGVNKLVGAFQYNYDATHNHWHFLSLDRYEVRPHNPATIGTTIARDQKTGFCLVDNSRPNPNPTDCEKGQPMALGLTEAVLPGGSDTYTFGVDGQFIDMSGVNPGTYELVEWVNSDCRLADAGPAGHTAAVTFNYTGSSVSVPSQTGANAPFWPAYYNGLSQKCLPPETQRPVVAGTAQVGRALAATPGAWLQRMVSPSQPGFIYQWRRCDSSGWQCGDISGATSAGYVPTSADLGHTLRARVTAVNAPTMEESSPQDSEATALVQPAAIKRTRHGLVVKLKSPRKVARAVLLRRGIFSRVRCSMRCRISAKLVAKGGLRLSHTSGRVRDAGTRRLHLRLQAKGKRIVMFHRFRTLTLWVHVVSSDGERRTVGRALRLT